MTVKLHASGNNRIGSLPSVDRGRIFTWLSDFSENQGGSGNQLHRVNQAPDLWTARISDDYRAVMFQDGADWWVLYVGHHDDAYRWAEGRRVSVDGDEVVMEFTSTGISEIHAEPPSPQTPDVRPLISKDLVSDRQLSDWGLNEQAIVVLRAITSVDTLLEYATNLPENVADRILGTACGEPVEASTKPGGSPDDERDYVRSNLDIRRTYYIVDGNEDLMRVVQSPMAMWIAFLHPSQYRIAYGSFSGPAKVSGGAGTGKTVVALHRARHLSRQGKRVLLTSYSDTLCANLREQLALLCTDEEIKNITISTVHEVALGLLKTAGHSLKPDRQGLTLRWLKELADYGDYTRSPEWYVMEWEHVVHAHGIKTLDQYLEISRSGRGSALKEQERRLVWGIFQQLIDKLREAGITDWATICMQAREAIEAGDMTGPYDAVVVDEMQDLRPQELRFLSALAGKGENALLIVGDMTQRIFVPRFSMRSAGIDVVGRSFCLRINYRTTLQIKSLADAVVRSASGDGEVDTAVSVYHGPSPTVRSFKDTAAEARFVADSVKSLLESGALQAHEIAVFGRHADRCKPVTEALVQRGIETHSLSRDVPPDGAVRVGSFHRAKGLEFKSVFVVGVSDKEVPDQSAVEHLFEPAALEEALERERQMLYVAMTRARDELTVTWTGSPSAFLPAEYAGH